MTASAKVRGNDLVVVQFDDKMLVLRLDEATKLHADLSRILGREQGEKVQRAEDALVEASKGLDRLSAEVMRVLKGVRDA